MVEGLRVFTAKLIMSVLIFRYSMVLMARLYTPVL